MGKVETELKYEADATVAEPPRPRGLRVVDERETLLTATYWDGCDQELLAWGVTLRHRAAEDGTENEWTLKVPAAKAPHGTSRNEISVSGSAERPPDELVRLVVSIVSADELRPVAELRTHRRIQVLSRKGRSLVELTDDRVDVVIDGRTQRTFREFEAELLDPSDTSTLAEIERSWRKAGLKPSAGSKLRQALDAPPPSRPAADRHSSVASFVSAFVEAGFRQLVDNELRLRVESDSTDAVHQARVATRRLRANLRTFRRMLDREITDPLRVELRWIGQLLGELRDVHVREQQIRELTEHAELSSTGLAELEEVGATTSAGAQRNLLSALDGERYRDLLADLRRAIEQPPVRHGQKPAQPEVRRAVRKRWKQIRQEVAALGQAPEDMALHDVRKHVKALRYGLQAAKPVGVSNTGLVKGLGVLQDRLGELHDTVVIRSWIDGARAGVDGDAAFLAGQLERTLAMSHDRLRDAWRDDWVTLRRRRIDDH